MDLDVLRNLTQLDAGTKVLQSGQRTAVLSSNASVLDAIRHFSEEESRLATSSVCTAANRASADHMEKPISTDTYDVDRPDRDFVDRLWLSVLSRCETAGCLVFAIQAVLKELGRHNGMVPCVRKESTTQMAELVRVAMSMSMLRRYAAPSEVEKLRALTTQWEESCKYLSHAQNVIPLVLSIGMECLCRDFVHIITRYGYVTARDLTHFTHGCESVALRLDRLRCLRHMAELALMSTRHRLWMDTMRRLLLKAAEYYQRPSKAMGTSLPIFAVPLSNSSVSRLLSMLPSLDPSAFFVECGTAVLQAERLPARISSHDQEPNSPEEGVWSPFLRTPYEYNVALFDRLRFVK